MVYRFGSFELDGDRYELRRSGEPLKLQPKVLDALLLLVRERHRVVLRRELLELVWGDVAVSEASVTRVIVEARRALGDQGHGTIVTVRSRGFRFTGKVVEEAPSPSTRPSGLRPTARDPRLAALGAKLEEARQLYEQLLEDERVVSASSLGGG